MSQQFKIAMLRDGATRLSCREANCPQYRKGWLTAIDETTVMGQGQAHYIRTESGRGYVSFTAAEARERWPEAANIPDGVTVFSFHPGQECFGDHLDREVLFVHRNRRGNARVHANPLDFNEDFNEQSHKAMEVVRRG